MRNKKSLFYDRKQSLHQNQMISNRPYQNLKARMNFVLGHIMEGISKHILKQRRIRCTIHSNYDHVELSLRMKKLSSNSSQSDEEHRAGLTKEVTFT